jgi:drug/metabolite transporter (DMT)-like permease
MKEKIQEYKLVLLIVVMAVTGATTAFFKIALREMPIGLFTFLRYFFTLLVFVPYLLTQKSEPITNRKRLSLIAVVASANVFFFVWGLGYTTAIISGMLYGSVPLVTSALAALILHEKVSFKKWLGIVVGFVGVLVIVLAPALGGEPLSTGTLFGNGVILLAVLSFCMYSVLSKKYSHEYSPITITKYFFFTTFILQTIFLLFHPSTFALLNKISLKAWLCVAYSGVIGTTVYYVLYQYVIKRASPVLASMTFFLQPLANIMWAKIFIDEKLSSTFFIGMIFIFLGMAVVFHAQYSTSRADA